MNSLLTRYKNIRSASVKMCEPLHIEDYIPQPAEFVSPPKWNIGHTTWFFETFILKNHIKDYDLFHPGYNFIFNSYYQAAGERNLRAKRGDLSRPTVHEVYEYRAHVDDAMQKLIEQVSPSDPIVNLIELGLNHEQQHQELFYADLKYSFAANPLLPAYSQKVFVEDIEVSASEWIQTPAGIYNIGYKGDEFHFDNEKGRHKVYLNNYEIKNCLVSNAEYLEFVQHSGYKRHEFWHADGWKWLQDNNIKHPMYWMEKDQTWFQFTLAGLRLLNPLNPVTHINYYEAAAFAAFKGLRLPTEFEWETACDNFNFGHRWEWTDSAYLPYPNYKKPSGAIGEYNGKFMVNQIVLRGGSVVSPEGHVRNTYRNFFHAHEGWQFNGVRLAR